MKALAVLAVLLTPYPATDLTGRWTVALDPGFSGEPATLVCEITQDRQQLTVECDDAPASTGTIDDLAVTFVIMTGRDNLLPARFSGILQAGDAAIAGTWRLEDTTGNKIGRFRAEKRTPQ